MKKTIKALLAIFVMIFTALSLTSCEDANTYRKFHNNGSMLPKDHILDEVGYKELLRIVEKNEGSDEYIYVFIGNPSTISSSARDCATVWNEQARQYGVETLYWLNSDLSDSKVDKLQEILNITDFDPSVALLLSFTNGSISFDSSSKLCNEEDGKDLTYQQIATRCFKNELSVNKKN